MFSKGGNQRTRPRTHLEATGLVTAGGFLIQVSQACLTASKTATRSPLVQDPWRPSQSTSNLSPDTNVFSGTERRDVVVMCCGLELFKVIIGISFSVRDEWIV